MAYLLLILEPGEKRRTRPPEEGRLAYERMLRFTEDLNAYWYFIKKTKEQGDVRQRPQGELNRLRSQERHGDRVRAFFLWA